jgi:hypothetical protein
MLEFGKINTAHELRVYVIFYTKCIKWTHNVKIESFCLSVLMLHLRKYWYSNKLNDICSFESILLLVVIQQICIRSVKSIFRYGVYFIRYKRGIVGVISFGSVHLQLQQQTSTCNIWTSRPTMHGNSKRKRVSNPVLLCRLFVVTFNGTTLAEFPITRSSGWSWLFLTEPK